MKLLCIVLMALLAATVVVARVTPPKPAAAAGAGWTTYHLNNSRDANDTSEPFFTVVTPGWTSAAFDGAVFAEPLFFNDVVYAATENNTIYALDAGSGAVMPGWPVHLGAAVDTSGFPCGNINPVGITSTPVIDTSSGRLYVVGLIDTGSGTPRYQHHLFAVNLSTRNVDYEVTVDSAGSNPIIQNQRGALALANSRVYVPYGGRIGDCGQYHGFVVGANAADGAGQIVFQSTTNNRAGGSWASAGASVDGSGNLYISTGNGYSGSTFDRAESVIKLDPALGDPPLGIWAPLDWQALDSGDSDIGSIGPMLLGNTGLIFQGGKNQTAYLLRQNSLGGGPGLPAFSIPISSGECFGGAAFDGTHIFMGCDAGLFAFSLDAGTPALSLAWRTSGTYAKPPILSGGAVWWMDGSGAINAANPASGASINRTNLGGATHFATPSAGGGKVFAPLSSRVAALTMTAPVGTLNPVTPVRLLDTRTPTGGHPGRLGPGQTLDLQIPNAGAGAAVLNVTATNPTAYSYLTVFPKGQLAPLASNLNFAPGQTIANLTQVAVGQGGQVSVYNANGSTDVVVDEFGWYSSTAGGASGRYRALAPVRVLDTRIGLGGPNAPFGAGEARVLDLSGAVPGASAVALNLTATQASAGSFLAAYPAGTSPASPTSNLNFPPGRDLPNRVIVALGTGSNAGKITIFNAVGYTGVVADLVGWYTNGSDPTAGGGLYHPLSPVRILDTRPASQVGPYSYPLGPHGTLDVTVAGSLRVVPTSAAAVAINVTISDPNQGSFVTVYPADLSQPGTSDLNCLPREVIPNHDLVGLGGGRVTMYNQLGFLNLVVDVEGYYS